MTHAPRSASRVPEAEGPSPLVIAHRTLPRHAPENSIAGIRLADELGADVVEVDVRGTRDLARVLMHDRTTRRTAGALRILSRTSLARVRALRVEPADGRRQPSPPPLLSEALAALGSRMGIAVEIKDPRIVAGALADIRDAGVADRAMLWSYSEHVVGWFVRNAPDIEVSLLRDTRTPRQDRALLASAVALGARGLSIRWGAIDPEFAAHVRARGLALYSMCDARSPDVPTARLLTGLITDWPSEARAALATPPTPRARAALR